jgi:hypothetical protein
MTATRDKQYWTYSVCFPISAKPRHLFKSSGFRLSPCASFACCQWPCENPRSVLILFCGTSYTKLQMVPVSAPGSVLAAELSTVKTTYLRASCIARSLPDECYIRVSAAIDPHLTSQEYRNGNTYHWYDADWKFVLPAIGPPWILYTIRSEEKNHISYRHFSGSPVSTFCAS